MHVERHFAAGDDDADHLVRMEAMGLQGRRQQRVCGDRIPHRQGLVGIDVRLVAEAAVAHAHNVD